MEMTSRNVYKNKSQETKHYEKKEVLVLCPKCGEPVLSDHVCGEMKRELMLWGRAFKGNPPSAAYLQFEHIYHEAISLTGGGSMGRNTRIQNEQYIADQASQQKDGMGINKKLTMELSAMEIEFLKKVLGGSFSKEESEKKKEEQNTGTETMDDFLEWYKRPNPPIDLEP